MHILYFYRHHCQQVDYKLLKASLFHVRKIWDSNFCGAEIIRNIAWQQDHERKRDLFPETQLSAAYTAKNPAWAVAIICNTQCKALPYSPLCGALHSSPDQIHMAAESVSPQSAAYIISPMQYQALLHRPTPSLPFKHLHLCAHK